MKFQALIIIIVILVSLTLFQATRSPHNNATVTLSNNVGAQRYPSATVPSQGDRLWYSTPKESDSPQSTQSTTTTEIKSMAISNVENSAIETPSVKPSSIFSCSISAPLYSVYNISTGRILVGQDVDHRWPIASITKLMTAIVASKYMDADTVIMITEKDQEQTEGYNSLTVGSAYTVRDLIKAALIVSSNDATYALARSFGYDAFINRMNEEARALNMKNTSFFDPSGLSYLNQSTLSDLALLTGYLYRSYGSLLAITRQKTVSITDTITKKRTTLSNIDYFAGDKDFIGGKTGYITQSGENLITLFTHNDSVWMVGVLGSADRFGDVQALLRCAQNSY